MPTACSATWAFSRVRNEILIGGRRRPMIGVVTMDQVMVNLGPDSDVAGGRRSRAAGRAGRGADLTRRVGGARLGTISYEVVCGLSPRLPRLYQGEDAEPA